MRVVRIGVNPMICGRGLPLSAASAFWNEVVSPRRSALSSQRGGVLTAVDAEDRRAGAAGCSNRETRQVREREGPESGTGSFIGGRGREGMVGRCLAVRVKFVGRTAKTFYRRGRRGAQRIGIG